MVANVITVFDSKISREGARCLVASHHEVGNEFPIEGFEASVPSNAEQDLKDLGIWWSYPWEQKTRCPKTDLLLSPYRTTNRLARVATLASHARLWFQSATEDRPIIVLEDDALFTRQLDPESLLSALPGGWGVIGLNDPRRATRRSRVYHAACVNGGPERAVIHAPWVDRIEIPQGIAGNSAYLIQPYAAKLLLNKAREVGGWPNDALMCRQFFPWLGQSTTFFTKVSGRESQLA